MKEFKIKQYAYINFFVIVSGIALVEYWIKFLKNKFSRFKMEKVM